MYVHFQNRGAGVTYVITYLWLWYSLIAHFMVNIDIQSLILLKYRFLKWL